ncbi:sperm acrosome-associated protein 9 [Bombina bombina]|uniref:sperm acrosome-associated protein 9 n=1 Tax=Bombina bombina TaxID=8345 RepID=UPI00235B1B0D|nr:sperm acrosome-associated protein 9 [Bombina bombina]
MDDVKQIIKNLEQRYRIFQQQQVTFITALERTRENAHDRIKPVFTLAQVRSYMDNYCNNSTDQRIISMFLELCGDLTDFCVKLDGMQTETVSAGGFLETAMNLLSPTNDLSLLRAKYPHDVVNHLSCVEAKNYYGGIVSVLPLALDNIQEAVHKMEKPQPHMHYLGSGSIPEAGQSGGGKAGHCSTTGSQTVLSQNSSSLQLKNREAKKKDSIESSRPAWRPTGRMYTS